MITSPRSNISNDRPDGAIAFARRQLPSLIETPGGGVEVAVAGQGPAVLAIHGGIGGYDQGLRVAAAALASERHTVVAVSRPGYLGTSLSAGSAPAAQADLYADVLDRLEVRQATVVAISAGGPSALEFAIRHRARCRALVLISAVTGPFRPRLSLPVRALRVLARWPKMATALLRRVARDPERLAAMLIGDPRAREAIRADDGARRLLIELAEDIIDRLAPRIPGTENDLRLLASLPAVPLCRVSVPVLAVHGTADRIVPVSHAEAVVAQVPEAELFAVPGGEHVCLFTHRDIIRARVRRFLAEAGERHVRRRSGLGR
jgi:pimeloyl-ACP methyl ester carboxylesterase